MKRKLFCLMCLGSLSLFTGACGNSAQPLNPDAGSVCDPNVYPCGPYGMDPGAVMENLTLLGCKAGELPCDSPKKISLAEYYQDKNVKALVISAVAWWCGYCKDEQPQLVKLYNEQAANGLALLEAVIEKSDGTPADITSMNSWANTYKTTFDMALDPSNVLMPYYDISAFPMSMVIRTSDMTITYHFNGENVPGLTKQIMNILEQ